MWQGRARVFGLASLTALLAMLFSFAAAAEIPIRDSGVPVTAEQVAAVRERYEKIPGSIRQEFEKNGNTIYFFETQPIVSGNAVAYVLGVYVGNEGVNSSITLTNEDYGGAEAIVHEMGHYFDDMIYPDTDSRIVNMDFRGIRFTYTTGGNRLRSDEYDFGWIWLSEAWINSAVTDYERSDRNEYFAGSFQAYVLEPEKLANVAPRTYLFIDGLVQDFVASHPAEGEYVDTTNATSLDTSAQQTGEGVAAWVQDEYGWRLRLSDGGHLSNEWALVDGNWYYFNADGYMCTGWTQVDGQWYYLFGNGRMATGWLAVDGQRYYLFSNGQMATGWQELNGSWYYFDPYTGALWTNGMTPDGYSVDQNGAVWQSVNNRAGWGR